MQLAFKKSWNVVCKELSCVIFLKASARDFPSSRRSAKQKSFHLLRAVLFEKEDIVKKSLSPQHNLCMRAKAEILFCCFYFGKYRKRIRNQFFEHRRFRWKEFIPKEHVRVVKTCNLFNKEFWFFGNEIEIEAEKGIDIVMHFGLHISNFLLF